MQPKYYKCKTRFAESVDKAQKWWLLSQLVKGRGLETKWGRYCVKREGYEQVSIDHGLTFGLSTTEDIRDLDKGTFDGNGGSKTWLIARETRRDTGDRIQIYQNTVSDLWSSWNCIQGFVCTWIFLGKEFVTSLRFKERFLTPKSLKLL